MKKEQGFNFNWGRLIILLAVLVGIGVWGKNGLNLSPLQAETACTDYDYSDQLYRIDGRVAYRIDGAGLYRQWKVQEAWDFAPTSSSWEWKKTDYFYLSAGEHVLVWAEGKDAYGDTKLDKFRFEDSDGNVVSGLIFEAEDGNLLDSGMVRGDNDASGGKYLFFENEDYQRAWYSFNIPADGNYRLRARVINTADKEGRGLWYTIYQGSDPAQRSATLSVTLPEGATIREDAVWVLWSGRSHDTNWEKDTEAKILVNGVEVQADSSKYVVSGYNERSRKTYWAKIPSSALNGNGPTYNFTLKDLFDFRNPALAPWGAGIFVVYEDPSLEEGWVKFRPWGQFIKPIDSNEDNVLERCVSRAMIFEFSPLNQEMKFKPFFFAADGNENGFDQESDYYRPNYLQWAYGTGAPLSGSFTWQDYDVEGATNPPDKTKGYFAEARDSFSWDSIDVVNSQLGALTLPAKTEWVAFRILTTGDGSLEADEPLDSLGETLTWSGGGGTFQSLGLTSPSPTPTLTPVPSATPTPTATPLASPTPTASSTPTPVPSATPTPTSSPTPTTGTSPTPTPTAVSAWFNILDGDLYSEDDLDISIPSSQYLVENSTLSNSSGVGGLAMVGGNFVNPPSDQRSRRGWAIDNYQLNSAVAAPSYTTLQAKYGYDEATVLPANNLASLTSDGVYKYSAGDLIINGPQSLPSTTVKAVIFVDQNLLINGDFTSAVPSNDADLNTVLSYRYQFAPSLVFIVAGNLTISPSVNAIYGLYLIGGQVSSGVGSERLYIYGSLTSLPGGSLALERDLASANADYPAEMVIGMPKYYFTLVDLVGESIVAWQEAVE